jgi:mono/diheme cytochrome c family protein
MPRRIFGKRRSGAALAAFTIGMALLIAGAIAWFGTAEAATEPQKATKEKDIPTDDLQRSLLLDNYRIVADSGAGRGEVLYAYKCWMCHNKYTNTAPYLQDLYQRKNLGSGVPVNDDTVTAKIKDGGPGMPAFRISLSDADIADLRAYFHSGKCCVEGENPPANPWYRAETSKWQVQNGLTGGPQAWCGLRAAIPPKA